MPGASTSTRFSDQPALSRRKRAALLLALLLVYAVLVVLSLTHFYADGDLERAPALHAYSVPLDPPSPPPPPASPAPTPQPAGAAGIAAKAAKPKPVVAAPAKIPNKAMTAAPAASTGVATKSGATSTGTGTGGGTTGFGPGSGGNGDGDGAGVGAGGSRAVKIAGDITATRDYPAATRGQRLGSSVIVVLTVGVDGRVRACRVHKPSPDPEADVITCRLATERFRFRPATDRAGNAIETEYGWQQSFFVPGTKPPS